MANLKTTQQDIADALNISRVTVSKVFNGKPLPNKVRDAVIKKALELGYIDDTAQYSQLNSSQPEIKGDNSSNLLLLYCFPEDCGELDPDIVIKRWEKFIGGMESACSRHGATLLVSVLTGSQNSFSQILEQHTINKAIGIVVAGQSEKISLFLDNVLIECPVVVADASDLHHYDFQNNDVISYDIFRAIRSIIQHFAHAGHEKIAFISGSGLSSYQTEIRLAVLSASAANNVASDMSLLVPKGIETDWKEYFIKRIQAQNELLPTAFICDCDSTALQVKEILEHSNYHIPSKFCIAGFDSIDESTLDTGLTTTFFGREALGQLAVEQLMRRIENPETPFLMIRQSVKVVFQCKRIAEFNIEGHVCN